MTAPDVPPGWPDDRLVAKVALVAGAIAVLILATTASDTPTPIDIPPATPTITVWVTPQAAPSTPELQWT